MYALDYFYGIFVPSSCTIENNYLVYVKDANMEINYGQYLKLDTLLSLQTPVSRPEAEDELLFISVHQSYELWFKQILQEAGFLCKRLREGNDWQAAKKIRRILVILKLLVQKTDVLETMTPRDFSRFRSFLETASGLQSYQFRELEILCGWRHRQALYDVFAADSTALKNIKRRLQEETLWTCFCTFLRKYEPNLPALQSNSAPYGLRHLPSEELQLCLLKLVKAHAEVDTLVELFVDFDEGLQEWRYRHVKMLERTIGNTPGTGGTSGLDYLKATLHRQFFPDLWALRNRF